MFDLRAFGGASAFLEKQEPGLVAKLLDSYGREKGAQKLAAQLDADADFGIDVPNGALLYACEGLAVSSSTARRAARRARARAATPLGSSTGSPAVSEADPACDQAFKLASRSSSSKKIWLDFTGCTIRDTVWNWANQEITIPPYDKDGTISGEGKFNSDEMSDIVAIWRGVAEDFAPFDVDITTIPPAEDTKQAYISHVCIGGNGAGTGYEGAGGVGYINTLSNPYMQPALVFPKNLGPDIPKYVWEATSHEIGHNLGLSHDGTTGAAAVEYYDGQGDWAPIMGVGYYKPLTHWSKGEYAAANNKEDDLAIIASQVGRAPSLAGNSLAAATALRFVTSTDGRTATATANSIVTQPGVSDFFKFYALKGTATIAGQVTARLISK
ncbi:hypothetical protein OEZ86_002242 [Tetradesmus obliquus]|nr:hypothetical protein OEZ86_002242 [Tetradesmus obliquus]